MTRVLVAVAVLFLFTFAPVALAQPKPPADVQASAVAPSHEAAQGFVSAHPSPRASTSTSTYDEQMGLSFTQSFTSMTYTVTAVQQQDPVTSEGPAYLLNGLSDTGYWYQVGLGWNWYPGYYPGTGFDLLYEVFDTTGSSIFPTNGGAGLLAFSGAVNQGDNVELKLYFSGSQVVMKGTDLNTGASALQAYSTEGGTKFVGTPSSPANTNGFFTGLMTEWYHSSAYYGNVAAVTYTSSTALTSAWMWIDEFECTDYTCASINLLFSDSTPSPVVYSNPSQLQSLISNGATLYSNAYSFITGSVSLVAVTMSYSLVGGGTPTSPPVLQYYQNGVQQALSLSTAPTPYLMDAGSQWSVTASLLGPASSERWETSQATSGTAASSQSVAWAYYHQYQVTFSAAVVGAGNGYSSPSVSYSGFGSSRNSSIGTAVWADAGSAYSFPHTLPGSTGAERWAASSPSGTIAAAGTISMRYYHQFLFSLSYQPLGGAPPSPPSVVSLEFGAAYSSTLSTTAGGYWLDSASPWSVNGSAQQGNGVLYLGKEERWVNLGTASGTVDASSTYSFQVQHQYYLSVGGSPSDGVAVLAASAWHDSGATVGLNATALAGWEFEGWTGTGPGAYTGSEAMVSFTLDGPANETATFYPGLTIAVTGGGSVEYSYGTTRGTVTSSQTLYAPVGTSVTLAASPSSFFYSFNGWGGALVGSASQQQVQVSAPAGVTAAFGYDYVVIGGISAGALLIVAGAALLLRRRRLPLPPPPAP